MIEIITTSFHGHEQTHITGSPVDTHYTTSCGDLSKRTVGTREAWSTNVKIVGGVETKQIIGQFGTEIHSDQNNGGESSTCRPETVKDEGFSDDIIQAVIYLFN